MAYDAETAVLLRKVLGKRKGISEKKMFGGVAFLLNGNMCVGIFKSDLILRVGPDAYGQLLDQPHHKEFDITGRAMRGWIMVEPQGYEHSDQLKRLLDHAIEFVKTLPKK